MGNMLSHAVNAHSRMLQKAAGIGISIHRAGSSFASGTGVLTSRDYLVFDSEGLPQKKRISDWIISLAGLSYGSHRRGEFGPDYIREGDVIQVCDWPGEGLQHLANLQFVVCPITPRPAVETLDDVGCMITVHSEQIRGHA